MPLTAQRQSGSKLFTLTVPGKSEDPIPASQKFRFQF